jgi:hypothetical protein
MNSIFTKVTLILWTLGTANLSWAALSSTVDRTELETNETLELIVTYDDRVSTGNPNFSPIKRDFEIFSTSSQQQISVVNGNSTSSTNWTLLLMPKRQGRLQIPALSFKGDTSNSIDIVVRPANSSGKNASDQPIFTETSVDKDSAYIQEQILLTHRLYYSVPLSNFSITDFNITDALIEQIGDNQYQKRINGISYSVLEIKFALFPQTAGKLEIPTQRINAYEASRNSQFGGLFSRGKQIARLTQAKTVDVMSRPAHIAPNKWMPSSQLSLKETWSDNSTELTAGEPITRTVVISAQGLTAAQIQPLPTSENNAFKTYPDQPKLEDGKNTQGVVGTRTETIAIVPNRAGQLTLPAIEIQWWDTVNNRMQTSTLPARTFSVVKGESAPPISLGDSTATNIAIGNNLSKSEDQISHASSLTRWSLSLNALLIATLVGLLYFQRRPMTIKEPQQPISGAKQYLNQIAKLAADNNLGAMRDHILIWGAQVFPQQPPRSLNQLADLMANSELKQQFANLDQLLFKADSNESIAVDTATIIKQLKSYKPVKNTSKDGGTELKSLYPDS